MKLEINITKGKFWALTIICIVAISAIIYAAGSEKPNPGHSIDEINGLQEMIQRESVQAFHNAFYVEKIAIHEPNTLSQVIDCNSLAIGCSMMKTTDEENEDVGYCRVNEEKDGCIFSWDIDDNFDENINAYCYCVSNPPIPTS